MHILGYAGSSRGNYDQSRRRIWLLDKLKQNVSYYDQFMEFSPETGTIPLYFYPLRGLGHDCSAAMISDGKIVAAAAEERFNRRKHSMTIDGRVSMPRQSIEYCLKESCGEIQNVDYVAYYLDFSEDTFAKRQQLLAQVLPQNKKSAVLAAIQQSYDDEFNRQQIHASLDAVTDHCWDKKKLICVPHHLCHAAASYYNSGFPEAGILTLDGYGEYQSSLFALGERNKIDPVEETVIPHSLGIMYMIITVFLGFRALNDEYKVMGLAAYGNPAPYRNIFKKLIPIKPDSHYDTSVLMRDDLKNYLSELFGPPRLKDDSVTHREENIAAALQERIETCVFARLNHIKERYGCDNLCLSGGVALNSVLNGKIAKSGLFKNLFIFPAAADDGCSVGAAQYAYYHVLDNHNEPQRIPHVYWGPSYTSDMCIKAIEKYDGKIRILETDDLEQAVVEKILAQKVIGWFQDRMEFGPRALGSRSFIADPRNRDMKDIVNEKVKWREMFRPFAPVVIKEHADSYFQMQGVGESPYMLYVVPVKAGKSDILPATTHCDNSARVQTLKKESNPRLWNLLNLFGNITGVYALLNTSFNVKGEPIVCSPDDAIRCFLKTNVDYLVLNDYLIEKI